MEIKTEDQELTAFEVVPSPRPKRSSPFPWTTELDGLFVRVIEDLPKEGLELSAKKIYERMKEHVKVPGFELSKVKTRLQKYKNKKKQVESKGIVFDAETAIRSLSEKKVRSLLEKKERRDMYKGVGHKKSKPIDLDMKMFDAMDTLSPLHASTPIDNSPLYSGFDSPTFQNLDLDHLNDPIFDQPSSASTSSAKFGYPSAFDPFLDSQMDSFAYNLPDVFPAGGILDYEAGNVMDCTNSFQYEGFSFNGLTGNVGETEEFVPSCTIDYSQFVLDGLRLGNL